MVVGGGIDVCESEREVGGCVGEGGREGVRGGVRGEKGKLVVIPSCGDATT